MAKLYGISVGVGDSELISLKALKVMNKVDIIAAAGKKVEEAVAYQIARGASEEIEKKQKLSIYMPMTKDKQVLEDAHKKGADLIEEELKKGKDVGFLVLGDASIYSTYYYLHEIIKNRGYEVEMISGITSFCAVAARLGIDLVSGDEMLHIIPASYGVEEALEYKGTKVLMKAGKEMKNVKKSLKKANKTAFMVENCGLSNEKIYTRVEDIPDEAGYFSLIIVKD